MFLVHFFLLILDVALRITSFVSCHINFIPDFRVFYVMLSGAEKFDCLSIHDIIKGSLKHFVIIKEPGRVMSFSSGIWCNRFENPFCSTLLSSYCYLIPLPLMSFYSFLSFVLWHMERKRRGGREGKEGDLLLAFRCYHMKRQSTHLGCRHSNLQRLTCFRWVYLS